MNSPSTSSNCGAFAPSTSPLTTRRKRWPWWWRSAPAATRTSGSFLRSGPVPTHGGNLCATTWKQSRPAGSARVRWLLPSRPRSRVATAKTSRETKAPKRSSHASGRMPPTAKRGSSCRTVSSTSSGLIPFLSCPAFCRPQGRRLHRVPLSAPSARRICCRLSPPRSRRFISTSSGQVIRRTRVCERPTPQSSRSSICRILRPMSVRSPSRPTCQPWPAPKRARRCPVMSWCCT